VDPTVAHFLDEFRPASRGDVEVTGTGALPSAFAVTDFAAAAVGAAGAAAARLVGRLTGRPAHVEVDRRLASHWFTGTIRPVGWEIPSPWDSVAGDYPTADGWIKLHTNAPHHKAAAVAVLGTDPERGAVGAAVLRWAATDLEDAVVGAGGCAAALRPPDDWVRHPQGRAVAAEPLIDIRPGGEARGSVRPTGDPARPLAGVRVVDLTRVLAGPVATRFLAGFGADVLRLDPPWWAEPGVVPEVTLGKRCARLDLCTEADRAVLWSLIEGADIVVHGYRSDALERLGFGAAARSERSPGLVDVSLDAYGWTGPWATRRGFDSLVQMSSGIAWSGREVSGADHPVSLPVQALDHAAGYVLAAAAIDGWTDRLERGTGSVRRTSLARVAKVLLDGPAGDPRAGVRPVDDGDFAADTESTSWGPARRLRPPVTLDGRPPVWHLPATALGSVPLPAHWGIGPE